MRTTPIRLIFAVMVLSQTVCTGQPWEQLPWQLSIPDFSVGIVGDRALGVWARSRSGQVICTHAGNDLISSVDGGRTWHHSETGLRTSQFRSYDKIVSTNGIVYAAIQDGGVPYPVYLARSIDGGRSFTQISHERGVDFGPRMSTFIIAHGGMLVLQCNALGHAVSIDSGQTWSQDRLTTVRNPQRDAILRQHAAQTAYMPSRDVVAVVQDSMILESTDEGRTWRSAAVSRHAIWHMSTDWGVVSFVHAPDDAPYLLIERSGVTPDTLYAIDREGVLPPISVSYPVAAVSSPDYRLRIWMRNGDVCTLNSDGTTWMYNGRSEPYEGSPLDVDVTDDGIGLHCNQFVYACGSKLTDTVRIIGPSSLGVVKRISADHWLAKQTAGILTSSDKGKTWYGLDSIEGFPSAFEPLQYSGVVPFRVTSMWTGPDLRIWTSARHPDFELFRTASSALELGRWRVEFQQPASFIHSPECYVRPSGVRPTGVSAGYIGGVNGFVYVGTPESTGRLPTTRQKNSVIASVLHDGTVLSLADSVYVSSDTGRTWRSIGPNGLLQEADIERIHATSIIGDPTGTMYVGLGGLTVKDGDEVVTQELGGVWTSSDAGATWRRLSGMDDHPHVLSMSLDSTGTLFVCATQRTRSVSEQSPDDYGIVVYVSRDGVTLRPSFSEFYSAKPHTGVHTLLSLPDGQGTVYASVRSKVHVTTDQGTTWIELDPDQLTGTDITSMIWDADAGLIVATDSGLFRRRTITSVEGVQADDGVPYTSVWCYPIPAKNRLTVRLNHLRLASAQRMALKVISSIGEEVADLTSRLREGLLTDRFEFDLDVSAYPTGVYVISLEAGKHSDHIAFPVYR